VASHGDLTVEGLAPFGFDMSESQVRVLETHPSHRRRREGRGSGFSVEAPEGVRFLIRSRPFTDDERQALDGA
jgi:uncharacterized protein (DUF779 family)